MNFLKPIFKPVIVCAVLFYGCNTDDDDGNRCNLEPDAGPCEAYFPKYYFDQQAQECKEFIWGGCDGVVPFDTLEECSQCLNGG